MCGAWGGVGREGGWICFREQAGMFAQARNLWRARTRELQLLRVRARSMLRARILCMHVYSCKSNQAGFGRCYAY